MPSKWCLTLFASLDIPVLAFGYCRRLFNPEAEEDARPADNCLDPSQADTVVTAGLLIKMLITVKHEQDTITLSV